MIVFSVLVAIILSAVALLHFYWSFGGLYGISSAAPRLKENSEFKPPKAITFLVACLIASIAVLALLLVLENRLFNGYLTYCGYAVSLVFIVRAIGDFRYLGFFKKVYNSNFSKKDTLYFSPLCLMLGAAFTILSKYSS